MRALLALSLVAFPRPFRERFGAGMLEVMFTDYERCRARGRGPAVLFVAGALADALIEGLGERVAPTWTDPHTRDRARRRQMQAMLDAWARDLRLGARGLARAPGFTFVTVATLALAISSLAI